MLVETFCVVTSSLCQARDYTSRCFVGTIPYTTLFHPHKETRSGPHCFLPPRAHKQIEEDKFNDVAPLVAGWSHAKTEPLE